MRLLVRDLLNISFFQNIKEKTQTTDQKPPVSESYRGPPPLEYEIMDTNFIPIDSWGLFAWNKFGWKRWSEGAWRLRVQSIFFTHGHRSLPLIHLLHSITATPRTSAFWQFPIFFETLETSLGNSFRYVMEQGTTKFFRSYMGRSPLVFD